MSVDTFILHNIVAEPPGSAREKKLKKSLVWNNILTTRFLFKELDLQSHIRATPLLVEGEVASYKKISSLVAFS